MKKFIACLLILSATTGSESNQFTTTTPSPEEITTTPATTIEPTTAPFVPGQLIGCFRDVFGSRDLEHEVEWEVMADFNTNSMCARECLTRGYKYAGCQMAVMCLCGNNYGAYGFSDGCTLACPGNKTEICGGRLANTVIYTGQGFVKATTTEEMKTTDAVSSSVASSSEIMTTTKAVPTCYDGFSFNMSSCYRMVTTGKSWSDAANECAAFVDGAHIVFINNEDENAFIKSLISSSGKDWWTGGYQAQLNPQTPFKWTTIWQNGTMTSKAMSYTSWIAQPKQPSGDGQCMQLLRGYSYDWNDLPCSTSNYFICEVEPVY